MQAKSGKKVKAVKPVKPDMPIAASETESGTVSEISREKAEKTHDKHGAQEVKPFKPKKEDDDSEDEKTSWVEIEMLDEADEPVAGLKYEVKLPDGSVASGVLDSNGFARISGCEPGECEISFPDLDKDAWEKA